MRGSMIVTAVIVSLCFGQSPAVDPPKPPPEGEPSFLTPLIEAGNIQDALNLSRAAPLKGDVISYSGFITVDKKYDSNLFFWYFPAENSPANAPVILWLQGAPGTSSLFGIFEENGPFYVKPQRGLKLRTNYWSQFAHMIYIDSPVGTGFSFVKENEGFARDQKSITTNLYNFLLQFYTMFRELYPHNFYIAGKSYGGKTAVELAKTIHLNNPRSVLKIKLKGLLIGNGLFDPANMMRYDDYFFQVGLIDTNGKTKMRKMEDTITDLVSQRKYLDAYRVFDSMIYGRHTTYPTLFYNLTQFTFQFNILHSGDDIPYGHYEKYLDKPLVRKAIRVGNLTFHTDHQVELFLVNDFLMSEKSAIEDLLENYDIIFYSGQLDVIHPHPLTANALLKLRWTGADLFKTQPRSVWKVGNEIAGYYKTVKTLTELMVRDAGHLVSYDQPLWTVELVKRFTSGKPFNYRVSI